MTKPTELVVRLSPKVEAPILEAFREELRQHLRTARIDHDRAKNVHVSPFSGHDALVDFHYTRGYWSGVASTVEVLDEILERLSNQETS